MKLTKRAVISMLSIALAGFFAFSTGHAEDAQIRIGQLDMERIYHAYPGMQEFQAEAQKLQQEFQQAQEAGNQQKMLEVQQRFRNRQEEFNRKFESDLQQATKAVSKSENVSTIVAKVIYHTADVETVDVSAATIAEMNSEKPAP